MGLGGDLGVPPPHLSDLAVGGAAALFVILRVLLGGANGGG